MSNSYFRFKQFTIHQDRSAMKVTTDACLFGAWIADIVESLGFRVEEGHHGKSQDRLTNALDIGTGTGLLSLMLAQKVPVHIDAIEIDEQASAQAKENVAASQWEDAIKISHADARDWHFSKKYAIIISNPPFYENEILSVNDKKNIAHHGQALQLHELFAIIRNNLSVDGKFFLLLPFKRKNEIDKTVKENLLYINEKVFVRQSVKHDYFRIMLYGSFKESEITTKEISVWNESQQYTNEFIALLKDYYLYL